MCAINPKHKKRFILDVYTADPFITKEQFENAVVTAALKVEMKLNNSTQQRWHIKETTEQAD